MGDDEANRWCGSGVCVCVEVLTSYVFWARKAKGEIRSEPVFMARKSLPCEKHTLIGRKKIGHFGTRKTARRETIH